MGDLGAFLKEWRQHRKLTLRDVEEMTGREVSNPYLSQLETGKIKEPSPRILLALSIALGVSYETLMENAGYIPPAKLDADRAWRADIERAIVLIGSNMHSSDFDGEGQHAELMRIVQRMAR